MDSLCVCALPFRETRFKNHQSRLASRAMYLPNDKDSSTFLWDGWPSDRHTDALPMMNSVFWPIGEYDYNSQRQIISKIS